ncbi:MAG: FYDLN acid domain-containing protein [Myxococcaceae bacterium]|nr:FYDLN acid domain-containing protein [Myxococcaceae bacterium]
MPARDLGNKFVCFKCSAKFYDMKKPDPVCPKCGTDQRESPANRPAEKTRGRLASVPKVVESVEEPIAPAAGDDEEEADDFEEVEEADDEEP